MNELIFSLREQNRNLNEYGFISRQQHPWKQIKNVECLAAGHRRVSYLRVNDMKVLHESAWRYIIRDEKRTHQLPANIWDSDLSAELSHDNDSRNFQNY